jgi:hypothetical protein
MAKQTAKRPGASGYSEEKQMKLAITLTAALIGGVALPVVAFGGPFGLPDNEIDGYRGTGCDPAQQVQITNAAGEYLYSNNPTCTKRGNGSTEPVTEKPEEPEWPGDDDGEGPGDDIGDDEGPGKDGCNGKKCNPGTGGGNSEGNENSDQDGD